MKIKTKNQRKKSAWGRERQGKKRIKVEDAPASLSVKVILVRH